MAVLSYEPWRAMEQLRKEMDRVLHPATASEDESHVVGYEWAPAVDIKEEADRFVIQADVPGVEPKDIDVSMDKDVLSIRGERITEACEEKGNYKRVERSHGVFHRRFSLPDSVDPNKITASGKNGVLEVVIPKAEAKQPRKIEVSA